MITLEVTYTRSDIIRAIREERIARVVRNDWVGYYGPIRKINCFDVVFIEPKALSPNLITASKENIKIKGIRKKIIIGIGKTKIVI